MLLFLNNSESARLTLNNAGSVGVTSSTVFDDSAIKINLSEIRECCLGNSCNNYEEVTLENPTNKELTVVLDGYQYEIDSSVQLIHSVNLFSIASTNMRTCMKASGGFPNIGSEQSNLAATNFYLGVSNAYLDVKEWRLTFRSITGDVVCENGTLINPNDDENDLIFFDGFDNIIFKNGFEQ